ncbi:unnamed protein product, partial [Phyllotreta striolata]
MVDIFKELGIPKKYVKKTVKEDRFIAVVNKLWLKNLVKHLRLIQFIETADFQAWPLTEDLNSSWMKVIISCHRKKEGKIFSLPKVRLPKEEAPLLFSQLMQYITKTNYINLWKTMYKKYSSDESHRESTINLVEYNDVLKEIIIRIYGCPIINAFDETLSIPSSNQFEVDLNIFPALCAVETQSAIFLLHAPYVEYNVADCVTFSPAIFDKSHTKSLFIIYQLLNVLKSLHERSLTLGEISLNDIYINEDMWVHIFPQIISNIHVEQNANAALDANTSIKINKLRCQFYNSQSYDSVLVTDQSLCELSQLWVNGLISNFTYISALNKFSGRVFGDPNCHYVFPWVTDFTSACGKNWRDLKKSKYRLNKGDHQLDLTYDNSQSQVPHHVSDVLSPITYYVYMARKTPKPTLCKNVRTVWVPAEYPSSIQRIQEWTPDECIPEFYSDPSVFRSIHEDLDDLTVPTWASDPEEFVEIHRRILECPNVSEKLHHWIDLTFGYRLTGNPAVRSRNICLNLVDDHENLTKSGLVQLFTQPHPPKAVDSPYFSKIPPKVFTSKYARPRSRGRSNSSLVCHDPNASDDERLPRDNSAKISRSRSSLHDDQASRSSSTQRTDSAPTTSKTSEYQPQCETIYLPKDYKPELLLDVLERKNNFFRKNFYRSYDDASERKHHRKRNEGFLNLVFNESQTSRNCATVSCNYKEMISARRIKELKVLGCLMVEIFMAKHLRTVCSNNLEDRLKYCKSVLDAHDIPPCVNYIVNLLLRPDNGEYSAITDLGLPSPSAHLLLEPLMHCTVPFSEHFPQLYDIARNLKDFRNVAIELSVLYHFDCDGQMCSEYESVEKTKIAFVQNVSECKVKLFAKQLDGLTGELNTDTDSEIVNIILPHVKDLIEDPPTTVLAAWYLFEPISRLLGPRRTSKYLLEPILKLYENECPDNNLPYIKKIAKLYHHSFLLCLMVRLGLKVFLENFVVPLVEAVGGYKDYDLVDFVLHDHSEKIAKRSSYLKTIETEQMDTSGSDESACSDKQKSLLDKEYEIKEEDADDEKNDEDQMKFLMEHLELNQNLEETEHNSDSTDKELGLSYDPEHTETNEVPVLKSPSIPIPQSRHKFVSNITCEVGSKKSDGELAEEASSAPRYDGKSKSSTKISDVSSDSLIWLSHRLGPLLTAKYLSRNLLKMLALCYIGKDNVSAVTNFAANCKSISITSHFVKGDQTCANVLECLTSISGLYGEQIIIFQYIPYMTELILLCKKRITPNLEGGLLSCLTLLKNIIPYLSDSMLMNQLQDVILKNIIHPIIRLLNSTNHAFPSGGMARNTLARKYLDVIYVLSIRIGVDMTKKYLLVPAMQRFFQIFDKVYKNHSDDNKVTETAPEENLETRALSEIQEVFTKELAHKAYVPFVKLIGVNTLENGLNNFQTILKLCQEYEEDVKMSSAKLNFTCKYSDVDLNPPLVNSSSIGSNIAVIGNRIELQSETQDNINVDLLSLVSNRIENSSRHLRGNWLAYWEHEIGRSEKDVQLNFKQIKLQTFIGHTQGVKCLQILDNENSFMSGSRDKTVKLWSMRSQGDGFSTSNCQWTYNSHKKSILSITFLESLRLVASCDGIVHVWDPFMGANVGNLESPKFAPVNTLKSMPAPSTLVFTATTDGTLKVLDTRLISYIQELKISTSPPSLIRCLAISQCGNWIAAGQSSGNIIVLDTRTGLVISNWRAHESEVLQLEVYDKETLVSSSLDQTTCVWNIADGKLKFHMRGTTEPVHCLRIHNDELISGTTGNRIGVHTSIAPDACFSNNKLRGDSFRGLLTSMEYMPLNRLLLLGADTDTSTFSPSRRIFELRSRTSVGKRSHRDSAAKKQ